MTKPAKIVIGDLKDDRFCFGPEIRECRPHAIHRASVHRIVRHVQLLSARRFCKLTQRVSYVDDRERKLVSVFVDGECARAGQTAGAPRCATSATSLSPRPLRHTTIKSSGWKLDEFWETHAIAWAVSSAGIIPSRRLSVANA